MSHQRLELLAPAKTADIGIAAITHGADAVYIGGPAFGARSAAGNAMADIARLASHAHRYHARVFLALNTLLRNDELETARTLAWQAFEAGVDALIVQDMGLLELDLPPLPLHASTQCDIRDTGRARFLQDAGFSRLVLARELSLAEVREIAAATTCELEYFIHGALCVAFSGQCYISHAHTGRSANRGECSQACRLPYDLADGDGRIVARGQHLLSLKDNNQGAHLAALAAAGIHSFKIEGRYKDMAYVKNITAHYRRLLDEVIEHPAADGSAWRRASSGRCTYTFTPQAEKTFNRAYTDYFAQGRQHGIEAFTSPAFTGEPIGKVIRIDESARRFFDLDATVALNNGDGLAWLDNEGKVTGLRVNRVEAAPGKGVRIHPASPVPASLCAGTTVSRNHDHAFMRLLDKPSAERRIRVAMHLVFDADACTLTLTDEDGITASARLAASEALSLEAARQPDRALADIRRHLGKLGDTPFAADIIECTGTPCFLPAAAINALRRDAVTRLDTARLAAHLRAPRATPAAPPTNFPQDSLNYLANVLNDKARAFYEHHGVKVIEAAFEANETAGDVSLMVTRHCLRYSFNLCPKEVPGIRPEPMRLIHGRQTLTLRFDCKRCEMHVVGQNEQAAPPAVVRLHPAR
ncbi:MAG: U32 family peptidase [Azoarcus sp.]|jgi:putative protease|nr:U32 family peptidase [Azoarcus sp.]